LARLELADQLLRELSRSGPVTRVVARLTAARLRARDHDFAAGRFQQAQGREPDARAHEVHQAGDEEANAHNV
jgi:hypothetical protein